jgi:two-component system OmpR family response regulator
MVNDEPTVLDAFAIILQGWFKDATIITFCSGADALKDLSQTDPDLLITDDLMPRMRGSELCQRLLDRKAVYPIVVTSPFEPTEQWVRELASRGLKTFFLPQPCSLDDLQKVLETTGLTIRREYNFPFP